MYLKNIEISGFKSFSEKIDLTFNSNIVGIVGPNGSGKSNVVEAFRFVLGEQSLKTMRGKKGEDLIFHSPSKKHSRASVKLNLYNKNNVFNVDFDEISVERVVYKDGTNEYLLNGTKVRHRDIIETLVKANIGSTGHHIISQGEADAILNANEEGKKEILEDGLGLKLFQYRKSEAEKKLERAKLNIRETESIQRELAPHIKYLKKQIERYERGIELRNELKELYKTYLSKEKKYINEISVTTERRKVEIERDIKEIETKIKEERGIEGNLDITDEFQEKTNKIYTELNEIRSLMQEKSRKIGRLEAEIDIKKQNIKLETEEDLIKKDQIISVINEFESENPSNSEEYKNLFRRIISKLNQLVSEADKLETQSTIDVEEKELKEFREEITGLSNREQGLLSEQKNIEQKQRERIKDSKKSEQKLLELLSRKNHLEKEENEIKYIIERLVEDKEEFEREIKEGEALIGIYVHEYKKEKADVEEDRKVQKDRKRYLEKIKIQLESLGVDRNNEILDEYKKLSERNEFLDKEKKDINRSIELLETTISDLKKEIDKKFQDGVKLINKEFDNFFKILFGGGRAHIELVKIKPKVNIEEIAEEELEIKEGIKIYISLPHKKINALEQLSGGERALVSIALLFAMSQVTPPLFLILDETDAALDEANSVRYGNMIEQLSKKSQLILVTHNRETMYRTGILYGVTMNKKWFFRGSVYKF